MHVITGGFTGNVEYGCMYDAVWIEPDFTKEKDGKTLYGFYGLAVSMDDAPAVVWLDPGAEMQFVEGELLPRCHASCKDAETDSSFPPEKELDL